MNDYLADKIGQDCSINSDIVNRLPIAKANEIVEASDRAFLTFIRKQIGKGDGRFF